MRRRPGDDVMPVLLAQSGQGGGQVPAAGFGNMSWLFAVAGNETLRNGLPGACLALLEHPGAAAELRAGPDLLPVAADEMLRWRAPVMTFRRTATGDCELGGQPIRPGEKVVVSFTSASRDEDVFDGPHRSDIRRQPSPHLVFGHGPHFCLGARLARVQLRALFAEARTRLVQAQKPNGQTLVEAPRACQSSGRPRRSGELRKDASRTDRSSRCQSTTCPHGLPGKRSQLATCHVD